MKNQYLKIMFLSMFLCFATNNASADLFYLTESNEFGSSVVGEYFATVDIKAQDSKLYFTITANTGYFTPILGGDPLSSLLAWDKFYFNLADGLTLEEEDFVFINPIGNWSVNLNGKNVSMFGDFTTETAGTGTNGTNPLEFYIDQALTVANVANLNLDGYMFAGHLKNFVAINEKTSTFLSTSTPVPEPAMMLLFGTGLVGLVGVVRRRNKK